MNTEQLFTAVTPRSLTEQGYVIAGYDMHLSRLSRIVSKKGLNNVLIVGDAGVGKTTLALGLVANTERDFLILRNDALAEYIFSFQPEKIELEAIRKLFMSLKHATVFIDDMATLFATEQIFHQRFLSLLKLLLENPHIAVVAAIDQTQYRLYVEKDSILNKYFELLKLFEPNEELASYIISHHLPYFAQKYQLTIDSESMSQLVVLANRYITGSKQPGKTLKLIDEICAYAIHHGRTTLTINDSKVVLSERTGIPIDEINLSELERLQKLEQLLEERVKGQEHAIAKVSKVIRRSRSGLKDPKRPIGSFLFIGPSGVGKTFLAKTLSRVVYNDENALVRIDMSEFSESHNVQRLVGAPPGYVGYEEGGQLTNPVWQRPYSLILLDEIEKAHPRVFDTFLQVIDEGRLTDGQGKTVDFNNTILIATSNIGLDVIIEKFSTGEHNILNPEFIHDELMPVLLSYFRPEFINRFDEIIIFKPLAIEDLKNIARLEIEELNHRLQERSITIELSDETLQELAEQNYHPTFGARALKRAIRENIEDTVAHKLIFGEIEAGSKLVW